MLEVLQQTLEEMITYFVQYQSSFLHELKLSLLLPAMAPFKQLTLVVREALSLHVSPFHSMALLFVQNGCAIGPLTSVPTSNQHIFITAIHQSHA